MVFSDFLRLMVQKNASDLFITTGVAPCLKIDGRVLPITRQPLTSEQARDFAYGIMNDQQRREFEATQECNFAIHPVEIGRFRVSVYVQQGHVAMVLRTINMVIPTVEELNLPAVLADISMYERGLVILVGGTGTGKSTTMAALVGYRNEHSYGHIISIEDPIEFVHQHKNCIISQREVGVDTGSFDIALRNAMRQAPNVIIIGEIRSQEVMDKALIFAETGHLCFATLHANNTYQALERILNFFPEQRHSQLLMDLSMNLRSLVSQRLVPRRDGQGRVPAVEVLINSPLIAEMILKGRINEIREVMGRSTDAGMQTFDQSLFDLYEAKLITYEEAIRNAESGNDLRLRIKLHGSDTRDRELGASMRNVTY